MALWQWPDSAALVWPARRRLAVGSRDYYLELSLQVAEPKLVSIFDYKDMICCEITWRSYVFQYQAYPEWRETCPISIKPFLGKEMGMMQLAATKCFWSMSKSEVIATCKHGGVALGDTGSLYEVLSRAVSAVLCIDEGATLKVLGQRLADSEMCNEYSEAVLEVDSAVEVLEHQDREVLQQEQNSASNRIEARKQYQQEFTTNMRVFRLAQEAKKKRQKKGPSQHGTLPTKMGQSEAKKYIPPNTTIWRGLVNGSWQGECKPFARLFESWRKSSEPEAMRRVIVGLWQRYLLKEGLTKEDCPWEDLRPEL